MSFTPIESSIGGFLVGLSAFMAYAVDGKITGISGPCPRSGERKSGPRVSKTGAAGMDNRDPFKDLTFDGRPAGYRDFRRKVILGVAGLEDKVQHLAGPRLLQRLSGEAWRATEHLSISQIREDGGWLKVLEALDAHYKFLPETELHEAIDEFLFLLKRRANEGATAFTSRFRTQLELARVESLITQERALARKRKRQRTGKEPTDDSRRQQWYRTPEMLLAILVQLHPLEKELRAHMMKKPSLRVSLHQGEGHESLIWIRSNCRPEPMPKITHVLSGRCNVSLGLLKKVT
ncbi:unnamed protein product [Effrenium voratum]|nr:unnamed protein product [Effrenium voratum]